MADQDRLFDEVGRLDDRLRRIESKFSWGVGVAAAVGGLVAIVGSSFTTFVYNKATELGADIALIESKITDLNQWQSEINSAKSAALEDIEIKVSDVVKVTSKREWQSVVSRIDKIDNGICRSDAIPDVILCVAEDGRQENLYFYIVGMSDRYLIYRHPLTGNENDINFSDPALTSRGKGRGRKTDCHGRTLEGLILDGRAGYVFRLEG